MNEIICVTQRAYERVLSKLCDNDFPEQVVTQVPTTPVQVRFGLGGAPFDFTQLRTDCTLRDFLPKPPVDIVVQDLRNLWNFKTEYIPSQKDTFATPNGSLYSQTSTLLPGDDHILGFLELARCLFARQILHLFQPNTSILTPRTLYVRGGGQHGTVTWGALAAVLSVQQQAGQTTFDRFAGDSFGAALAVIAAIDASGSGPLYYDRMIEVCHRMKLDESDRPLDREAALDFAKFSLHEYVDKTLGELNLPVDILVTGIETGMEHAVWNAQTKPEVTLGDALVASMSIPVFIGAHSGCFDGGITAYEYTDRLGANSTVITLGAAVDLSKLQLFGTSGEVAREIVANWRTFSGFEEVRSVHGAKQISLTVRDPSLSIWGGSVGTTSWHVLNFQHGFDEAISQC